MRLGELGGSRATVHMRAVLAALSGVLVLCAGSALPPPARAAGAGGGPTATVARVGDPPAGAPLDLVLPLAANRVGLERFAAAVSTPGSPRYGDYEPLAQLARRFGASTRTRLVVTRYLRRAGARDVKIDATGLFADATMSAGLAQRLFATRLAVFRTARRSQFIAPGSSGGARVPRALRGLVRGVIGLDTRPLAGQAASRGAGERSVAHAPSLSADVAATQSSATGHSGTSSGCADGVAAGEFVGPEPTVGFTPNQYLTAYGFDPLHAAGFAGQGERVALIEIDGFDKNDIDTFAACFGLGVPALKVFGVGVSRPGGLAPGGEATLDLEVLDAAAPGLDGIDVYETRSNAANTLRSLTAPLNNRGFHPQVISASLGLCEPAVYAAVGAQGIEMSEAALAMAAANGITFLASSGDSGSADCLDFRNNVPQRLLSVNYPASSPWVTGVGGTNVTLAATNQIVSQVVWNDAYRQPGSAGGGGTSVLFRRPPYQKGAVTSGSCRRRSSIICRAVPDVSMLADVRPGYAVYCTAVGDCINDANSNPWQSVGGTSAGTPLLAGGLAIVDQELRMNNRQDLGLVNPLLYSIGRSPLATSVFSDVVQFNNDVGSYIPGNRAPLGCCAARPGFDRASGWGSVNVGALASAAVAQAPFTIALTLPANQRPLAGRGISVTVSCAGACAVGAYANVQIGHRKPVQVDSSVVHLPGAGARTFMIRFSRRELKRIRTAVRHRRRIVTTVYAVTIQGRRTVFSRTPGQRVAING